MIQLRIETPDIQAYLQRTEVINFDHPGIKQLGDKFASAGQPELEFAKSIYEYVRDEISHSGDIEANRVTCNASDVLQCQHGICCAKAHLLAALLRSVGIPTGFCYQKLRADERPNAEFVLHGLNALYLQSLERWIRVDARGNKPGVTAEFNLDGEKLAWPVKTERGERDDPVVYANPWQEIVNALQKSKTRVELHNIWSTLWSPVIQSKFHV